MDEIKPSTKNYLSAAQLELGGFQKLHLGVAGRDQACSGIYGVDKNAAAWSDSSCC